MSNSTQARLGPKNKGAHSTAWVAVISFTFVGAIALGTAGCTPKSSFSQFAATLTDDPGNQAHPPQPQNEGTSPGETTPKPTETPIQPIATPTPPSNPVCGFDGNDQGSGSRLGLKGELHYFEHDPRTSDPMTRQVAYYIQNGIPSEASLFFSSLNTPTRYFDQGFLGADGNPLTINNGQTLVEFFGIRFQSIIALKTSAPADLPGDYQFALFSDDGAIAEFETSQGKVTVDNDGQHPSRLACAENTVHFTEATRIPARIDYYQGPRYHIALMLLWRKVTPDMPQEPFCGSQMDLPPNSAEWEEMQLRGWQVLAPENFWLPNNETNPCN